MIRFCILFLCSYCSALSVSWLLCASISYIEDNVGFRFGGVIVCF